ncbi:MAG: GH3 auxin-responsive promoter family protein [Bacteroidota bacterium]
MLVDALFSSYIKYRLKRIELYRDYPIECQQKVWLDLLRFGKQTDYGKALGFERITCLEIFQSTIPLNDYSTLSPYISRAINGERDVLWPGLTRWFAKSSGTTGTRIKTLPVTRESLENNHYAGGKDLLACYHHNVPNRKLYSKKHLILGGSNSLQTLEHHTIVADLSAIIIDNLPFWTEFRRVPDKQIVLHSDWEEKLNRMAEASVHEDVAILAGVPSWMTLFGKKVLEASGKNTLSEVWPNLELYIHGGMNLSPYKAGLDRLIQNPSMNYVESYNASEGYFGLQDASKEEGLLLLTDASVFYEFIPMNEYQGTSSNKVITLEEVKVGVEYAMVITTNAGLWRYIIGDTLIFESILPYRFKVSGRTEHYINAFGEKAVVMHFEQAITRWTEQFGLALENYTVAPYFDFHHGNGGHEWALELNTDNPLTPEMEERLDAIMCEVNSDYATKRFKNLNMLPLRINILQKGTFSEWMKKKGKFGGQHKIPRVQNNRILIDELFEISSP